MTRRHGDRSGNEVGDVSELPRVQVLLKQHQATYNRIPPGVRKGLSPVEALARCRESERLHRLGLQVTDRGMSNYYRDKAAAVLQSLPASEVEAEAERLEAVAESTQDTVLRSAYRAKITQLRQDNPQPSDEIVKSAKADAGTSAGATHRVMAPGTSLAAPAVLNKTARRRNER